MSELAFSLVEQGMRLASDRAAVLAGDAANARTPGFVVADLAPRPRPSREGDAIALDAVALRVNEGGQAGTVEYVMGATAKNAVTYRALADQERAMLREYKVVAEEARR